MEDVKIVNIWNIDGGGLILLVSNPRNDNDTEKLLFTSKSIQIKRGNTYTVEEINKKAHIYKVTDFINWDSIPNNCSMAF